MGKRIPQNTLRTMENIAIPGGSCGILPLQVFTIWAATAENLLPNRAVNVFFAAQEAEHKRAHRAAKLRFLEEPLPLKIEDIAGVMKKAPVQIRGILKTLDEFGILKLMPSGLFTATNLEQTSLPERVKVKALSMYHAMEEGIRDKLVLFPRRILRMLARNGRKIARCATMVAMVLTTMLTKRTGKYGGFRGCCKASWISDLFKINISSVKTERRKLISEGWFTETTQSVAVGKKYGVWVELNLLPSKSRKTPKVQPQNAQKPAKVRPLYNQNPSTNVEDINQEPTTGESGILITNSQETSQKLPEPTWKDIQTEDIRIPERSETLYQDTVELGILQNTQSDKLTFFSAIERAKRKATENICGFVRYLVENPESRACITQEDEDRALNLCRDKIQAPEVLGIPNLVKGIAEKAQISPSEAKSELGLSDDAKKVKIITSMLKRARIDESRMFIYAKKNEEFRPWTRERWEAALLEIQQAEWQRDQASLSIPSNNSS